MAGKKKTSKTRVRDIGGLMAQLEDPNIGYWDKVRAVKAAIGVLNAADIIAMCAMEIELAAGHLEKSGTRMTWARLLFDAIKYRDEREEGGQTIVVKIDHGEAKGL
jgi:hypothetical protein